VNIQDGKAARTAHVAAAIEKIHAIEAEGVTPENLARIRDVLMGLAAQEHLFPSAEFPPPANGEKGLNRYPLQQDADGRFALYLNALNPGNETKPHDHTTWAVVVAVDGQELNRVYRRLDDGSDPEHCEVVEDHQVMIEPGRGICLMPDAIHSIHTTGPVPTRHLHMYGLALDMLDERKAYGLDGVIVPYNKNFMKPSATAKA
jgi:predicted metal-dependent enzyme (double-stranded beta helix superfamily)